MIAFLRGKVAGVTQDSLSLDVNGVGYKVYVTPDSAAALSGRSEEILLHTHMIVREGDMQLFGFLTTGEIKAFLQLLGVNGVGPKAAISILSYLKPQGLGRALAYEDVSILTKVPGIGKKTAQRIILELKDKFNKLELVLETQPDNQTGRRDVTVLDDAVEALLALGYGPGEAREALSKAGINGVGDVSDAVKKALRFLDKTMQ